MITLKNCNSKMLQAYGYDASTQTLAVRFGPEKVYHYTDVPPEVFAKMDGSESIGSTFAALIRNKFVHTVVMDEQLEEEEHGVSQ